MSFVIAADYAGRAVGRKLISLIEEVAVSLIWLSANDHRARLVQRPINGIRAKREILGQACHQPSRRPSQRHPRPWPPQYSCLVSLQLADGRQAALLLLRLFELRDGARNKPMTAILMPRFTTRGLLWYDPHCLWNTATP
jgi:hypothetical protein